MKKLKYPNAQVGQCPNCGGFTTDHEIGDPIHDEDGHIVYNYTCSSCDFAGQEVYDVVFFCQRASDED